MCNKIDSYLEFGSPANGDICDTCPYLYPLYPEDETQYCQFNGGDSDIEWSEEDCKLMQDDQYDIQFRDHYTKIYTGSEWKRVEVTEMKYGNHTTRLEKSVSQGYEFLFFSKPKNMFIGIEIPILKNDIKKKLALQIAKAYMITHFIEAYERRGWK